MIWRWANVQKMGDEKKRKSKKKKRVKDFFYALKKKSHGGEINGKSTVD